MTRAAELRSGKGHRDENFPVASRLIHPCHRPAILAFYDFVRTADDIADHATLSQADKLALLDGLEATLLGTAETEEVGARLRRVLAERGLTARHAQDLLTAFRMDVTKRRYADWDDLIHYCSYSAMPVGRFVLEVHGESRATWPASDALCAALQIINHLQDCGADYKNLDRVYIPLDALDRHGLTVEALGATSASPALRDCVRELTQRTLALLREAQPLASSVSDLRLGLEIAVIQRLAGKLTGVLLQRDPLSERVHLTKPAVTGIAAMAVAAGLRDRLYRRVSAAGPKPQDA